METDASDGGGGGGASQQTPAAGGQPQLACVKTEPSEVKQEPMDETSWDGAGVKCECKVHGCLYYCQPRRWHFGSPSCGN